jgi:hypothetical protein
MRQESFSTNGAIISRTAAFVPPTTKVTDFKANGVINVMHGKKEIKRKNEGNKLLGYYPIDTLPLYVSFAIDKNILRKLFTCSSS